MSERNPIGYPGRNAGPTDFQEIQPEDLRRLAADYRSGSRRASYLAGSLTAMVEGMYWQSTGATVLKRRLTIYSSQLTRVETALHTLSQNIDGYANIAEESQKDPVP